MLDLKGTRDRLCSEHLPPKISSSDSGTSISSSNGDSPCSMLTDGDGPGTCATGVFGVALNDLVGLLDSSIMASNNSICSKGTL